MRRWISTTKLSLASVLAGVALLATTGHAQESPSEAGLRGAPLQIPIEPTTTLGAAGDDPAHEFYRIVTPFVLPSGDIAVPLAEDREIRIFGPAGHHIRTIGGRGEGPGEFRDLDQAWARGDTIEAFDGRTLRITRFFPGDSLETVRLTPILSAQSVITGYSGPGWALTGVASAEFGSRDRMAVHSFGPSGRHLGEIAHTLGMARYRTPLISGPDPISPKAVFAAGGDAIYFGETLTPRVIAVNQAGDTLSELTWDAADAFDPEEASRIVIDAALDQAGPGRAAELQAQLEAFPVRDRVSVFWGLLVDELGYLWIRPFEPAEHSLFLGGFSGVGMGGNWRVFSPDGTELDSMTLPPRFEPAYIARDRIVGIYRDDLGVETVRVHPLERTP